jgi:hypothetical protein
MSKKYRPKFPNIPVMIKTYAEGSLFFLSVIIFQCLRILATYSVFSRHEEINVFALSYGFNCRISFVSSAKSWTQNPKEARGKSREEAWRKE